MKQTEVGLIPDDWEVKKLGEISNGFSYGVGAEAVSFNGSDRYIRITDIDDVTNRFSPNPLCSPKFYSSSDIVQENDILFARTGASVGKTYIYDKKDGRLIFAGFLMKLHVKDADSRFIFYQTLTDKYKAWVISESMRTGQPGLNLEQIKNFSIPLPPLPEQQRIAKALSDVDALISTTEKLLQKKKNIKQGAMQNLLTGKKRLPGFAKSTNYKQSELGPIPEDWEVKEFKQEATLINGRAYAQSELLKQGKYKVLRVGNFGTNDTWYYSDLELPENQYCKKGDLLYCWSCTYGAYIWNEEKTIYHYHIWKIIPKGADKEYLKYILNNDTENQMKSSNGSTMSHITKGFLENRVFIFPPLAEQQQIANVLSSMDKEIETLNIKLEKYRNLKTAMMQQLLTGKIRLM